MFRRHKVLTATELQAEIDGWTSDEEENDVGHKADKINFVITPPDKVDEISDNENIDDNLPILHDKTQFPNEMAGQFEIEYIYDDNNVNLQVVSELVETNHDPLDTDDDPQPSTSKTKARVSVGNKPKWSKAHNYKFDKQPINNEGNAQKALYEIIGKLCCILCCSQILTAIFGFHRFVYTIRIMGMFYRRRSNEYDRQTYE